MDSLQKELNEAQVAPNFGVREKTDAEYQDLAEKLFIVKHLKEKKELSEKEKSFIAAVEAVELTESERKIVMEKFSKIGEKKQ